MTIKVGNLMPKQEAKIIMQLVQPIEIVGSSYLFLLPTAFYPDYKKLDPNATVQYPYRFAYSVIMKSSKPISLVSKPANSECRRDPSGQCATIFCSRPDREIRVFYRSADMKLPQLLFAKTPFFPGEVACSLSFVPTFEPPQPQELFEVLDDEEPESTTTAASEGMFFVFLLDRSGSMNGPRIWKATQSLVLFIRSLPPGCRFAIISFGTNHEFLKVND